MDRVDHETKVSIGLIIVLIGAAITFGIMRQKVDDQGKDIVEIKEDVKTISYQVQGIEELKMLLRDKYASVSCDLAK